MAGVPRPSGVLVLCIAGLLASGCGKRAAGRPDPGPVDTAPTVAVAAAEVPPDAAVEDHGSKWRDDDDGGERVGGFQIFKEAWVYVDGEPVGVLREVELPEIPVAWTNKLEFLDFNPGDPGPHERVYQRKQWRVTDYLKRYRSALL